MPLFLQISQYIVFILAEFTNIILLWLIVAKSTRHFGSYKYIMMSFCVFSICYALIDVLTQPIIHIFGTCMCIYVDSFLKYEKPVAVPLIGLYCATFALCVSLLATHFVYRFVAICRPQHMHHFNGINLLRIYTVPFFISIMWFFTVNVLLAPSDKKSEYMRESIYENYNEDTFQLSYISLLYFYQDVTGAFVISWIDFIAAFILCGIMQSCILTMAIFGWKTYRKMNSAGGSMSKKTKELNNQLFTTLILQALIPLCTMFTPVGLLIIFPMFSINVGRYANAPSLYTGVYPALDAIVAIFMIRDYRNVILCKKREAKSLSNINPGVHYICADSYE